MSRMQYEGRQGREAGGLLTQGLGWFSLGLGALQLAAPGGVARGIGLCADERSRFAMRALGAREVASGIGILTRRRPSGWLFGRLGGDLLDLALLGRSFFTPRVDRRRLGVATAAVAGVAVLDALGGVRASRRSLTAGGRGLFGFIGRSKRAIRAARSITINRPPAEVYRFWRDFGNLPRFMAHLQAVHVLDDRRSHWVTRAPAGMKVEWDAEITEDRASERIAWRSLPSADIPNFGVVEFVPAPGGRGTEVHVELRYHPPGGAVGKVIAKLFGEEPGQQIEGDLRRFKQVLETGEVVKSDASIHPGPHSAQPPQMPL